MFSPRIRVVNLRRTLLLIVFLIAACCCGCCDARHSSLHAADSAVYGSPRDSPTYRKQTQQLSRHLYDRSVSSSGDDDHSRCDYESTELSYTECIQCTPTADPNACSFTGMQSTPTQEDCTYTVTTQTGQYSVAGCRYKCENLINVVECCSGYWGPQCQACPGGSSDPCSGKGTCFDRITGNGTCMCNSGFAGEQCERCAQENMYGPNCDIECECVYGVCHDTDGFCLCLPGYHGDKCDQPSPECSSMNCPAHSHCVVLEGASRDYTCDCDDGYQVTETNDALTCIEIDPCSLSVDCDINADCVPIGPNHYNCSCTTGYSGDGYFCRPINPCSNSYGGCPTNTTYCIYDGPGQYHCQCKWGYENLVENQGCTLVDICVTDSNCHGNADCVMIRAFEPKCTCKEGFLGDGVNCYGNILQQLLDLNSDHLGPLQGKLSRAYFAFQQSYGSVLANSGPFTVFVPNEDAFNKADPTLMSSANSDADFSHYLFGLHIIPTVLNGHQLNTSDEIYTLTGMPGEVTFSDRNPNVLRYRVKGRNTKAKLVNMNIPATNGMIHVVDRLLYTEPRIASNTGKSILELIAKEGLFNRLEAMIQEAALDTVIHDTEGPFTVFAPNNNAFDSLQHGALDYFASPEGKPKLVQLLKNHIISGFMLTSSDLLITERVTTMQSTTLSIAPNSLGMIQIEDPVVDGKKININQSDIVARNGHIHYVDGLIIPPSIMPLLPHRCDTTEEKIVFGSCVPCFDRRRETGCPIGSTLVQGDMLSGCNYTYHDAWGIAHESYGCYTLCNYTQAIPECCAGFYGDACLLCPGNYNSPCNNRGQCVDKMSGNGTCLCKANFKGTACELCADDDHYGENCTEVCSCIHGECENGPSGNGKCKPDTCKLGFTGDNCDTHINPCGPDLDNCHAHAQCDNANNVIQCICNAGYEGNGMDCIPINPCMQPNRGGCHSEAKCTYISAGRNLCECEVNWTGDGYVCVPVDNCLLPFYGGCDPYASCIYTDPGQNICECRDGFEGNGLQCIPIDSCQINNGDCHSHATCIPVGANTNNCTCNDGFVGDGRFCYGSITMELAATPDLTLLMNLCQLAKMDSYLANPALNVTLFAPMNSAFTSLSEEVHSQWINEENSPYCIQYHILNGTWSYEALKDREGPVTSLLGGADLMITLENDEVVVDGASILVQDIPATNGIIHMIDVVLIPPPIIDPGISYMSLLRLLELTSHFSKFKESLLILLPPTSKLWFSYPTLREILEKEPQCSSFNEYMVEYHLLNQLEVQQEYTVFVPTDSAFEALAMKQTGPVGIDLIKYHIFAEAKILSSELHDGFHHPTWLGHNYQLTFSHHDNQIWINSQAYIVERDMKTDKGVVHVIHAVLDVLANRCDINETATMMSECISCTLPPVCLDGYQPIIPLNGMHSNCQYTRQLRGRQYATDGCYVTCQMTTYTQICCQGFYGTSCRACPGGSVDPCNGHGTCHDGMGGDGICKCDEQFTGTACEMCAPGFYGNMCSQECPCVNGQCITSPVFDTVQCLCQGGWVGQYCNQSTISPDSTGIPPLLCPQSCHTNAYCTNSGGQLECICNTGFTGDGIDCQAIDFCDDNFGGCSENALCTNIPGSRVCECNEGYTGDGVYCVGIDPCESNGGLGDCHQFAECIYTGPNTRACNCLAGYHGDGVTECQEIDPCLNLNGGCSIWAHCQKTGPNQKICTCFDDYVGDGFFCAGNILEEMNKMLNVTVFNSLYQRIANNQGTLLTAPGPFTVFLPSNQAFRNLDETNPGQLMRWQQDEQMHYILDSHIVGCVAMTMNDLQSVSSLTMISGEQIDINISQGSLRLNDAVQVTDSDFVAYNGIIHEIDQVLIPDVLPAPKNRDQQPDPRPGHERPPSRNDNEQPPLLEVATTRGYTIFERLLEAAGLVYIVSDPMHAPFTIFMPSNQAFNNLPAGKLQELEDPTNIDTLREYLTYHMIRDREMFVRDFITNSFSIITLQGSSITVGCYGNQGDIYINDGNSKIIERNIFYNSGIVYGIDRVLELPSIGGRCDVITNTTEMSRCYNCRYRTSCPAGAKPSGPIFHDCRYSIGWYEISGGCRQQCVTRHVVSRCCANHFGPDCRECPGGSRNPCNGHGTCNDGYANSGHCSCSSGFTGDACEMCQAGRFGPQCQECQCSEYGTCLDSMTGDGSCFCHYGWTGANCDTMLSIPLPVCNPPCHSDAVCRQDNACQCHPHYSGNGRTCTVIQQCEFKNGGCSHHADCQQINTTIHCSCHEDYTGDGVMCRGVDRCEIDNGGCHRNASCRYTGPNSNYCSCIYPYQGDGIDCTLSIPPIQPCVNGFSSECSENAYCNYSLPSDALPYGDVRCICKSNYIGNGTMCNGNVYETLASIRFISEFFRAIMRSETTDGDELIKIFQDVTSKLTLFIPIDGSMPPNSTFDIQGIKSHIINNVPAMMKKDFENNRKYSTMNEHDDILLYESRQDNWYANRIQILEFDIPTTHGYIHIIKKPLSKPLPEAAINRPYKHESHSGLNRIIAVVVLSVVVLLVIVLLAYIWHRRKRRKLSFPENHIASFTRDTIHGDSVSLSTVPVLSSEKSAFDNPLYDDTVKDTSADNANLD